MTELGEIPKEWEIIKLNECGYIFGGNAFKSSSFTTEYKENDYQVIRMGNVQLGKLDLEKNPVFLSENLVCEKEKKYLLKEEDILISLTGTVNKTDYGNISWVDRNNKYLLNQRVGCLRNDNGEFNNRYYYYLLQSNMFRNQFFECGVGGTGNQANVSIADLNNIKVLKVPIREQEKIASVLSTVDEQIDNVDALIEKNKELKKGLIQTLLTKGIGHTKFKKTEIGEIPEEWQVESMNEIVISTQLGTNTLGRECDDIPMLKMGNLTIGGFDLNKLEYISEEELEENGEYILNNGDFLFNTRNTLDLVGKSAVWNGQINKAIFNSNIMRIKYCNKINDFYMGYYFSSDIGWKQLKSISTGTTSVAAIYTKDLMKIKVIIPSIGEQEKIVSILLEVDKKIEEYENKKQKLEELKKGLMQQLLTGMIRVTV